MIKSIFRYGHLISIMPLMTVVILGMAAHAATWPYAPEPTVSRDAHLAWVCTNEPVVTVPAPTGHWDKRYRTVSSPYGLPGLYRRPFGSTSLQLTAFQTQIINYPLIRRCRLQVVVPGLPR